MSIRVVEFDVERGDPLMVLRELRKSSNGSVAFFYVKQGKQGRTVVGVGLEEIVNPVEQEDADHLSQQDGNKNDASNVVTCTRRLDT